MYTHLLKYYFKYLTQYNKKRILKGGNNDIDNMLKVLPEIKNMDNDLETTINKIKSINLPNIKELNINELNKVINDFNNNIYEKTNKSHKNIDNNIISITDNKYKDILDLFNIYIKDYNDIFEKYKNIGPNDISNILEEEINKNIKIVSKFREFIKKNIIELTKNIKYIRSKLNVEYDISDIKIINNSPRLKFINKIKLENNKHNPLKLPDMDVINRNLSDIIDVYYKDDLDLSMEIYTPANRIINNIENEAMKQQIGGSSSMGKLYTLINRLNYEMGIFKNKYNFNMQLSNRFKYHMLFLTLSITRKNIMKIDEKTKYNYIDKKRINYYLDIINKIKTDKNKYFNIYHYVSMVKIKKLFELINSKLRDNEVVDINNCKNEVKDIFILFNEFKDILESYI